MTNIFIKFECWEFAFLLSWTEKRLFVSHPYQKKLSKVQYGLYCIDHMMSYEILFTDNCVNLFFFVFFRESIWISSTFPKLIKMEELFSEVWWTKESSQKRKIIPSLEIWCRKLKKFSFFWFRRQRNISTKEKLIES